MQAQPVSFQHNFRSGIFDEARVEMIKLKQMFAARALCHNLSVAFTEGLWNS